LIRRGYLTPTPGRSLIRAWVRDWMMLSGLVRRELCICGLVEGFCRWGIKLSKID
jgi:hypothetical protein